MSHKSTILIVDDEPIGRQLIDAILYKEGYNLEFAENGREAFEKAKTINPDLILMDVMMPEIDGFEVCQMLRADDNMINVPIILVTALDDIDSRIRGLEAGADDYISKPFDRLELLARIKIITRLNKYRKSESGGDQQTTDNNAVSSHLPELINIVSNGLNNLNDDIKKIFSDSFLISLFNGKQNNNLYSFKKENGYLNFSLCGGHLVPDESVLSFYLSNAISKSNPGQSGIILNKAIKSLKPKMFSAANSVKPFCSVVEYKESSHTLSFFGLNNSIFIINSGKVNLIQGDQIDFKVSGNELVISEKQVEVKPGFKVIILSGSLLDIEINNGRYEENLKKLIIENKDADLEIIRGKLFDAISSNSEIEKLSGNIVVAGISL